MNNNTAPLAIILLFGLLFFFPMISTGLMPGQFGDFVSYFSYIKHFFSERTLQDGKIPLWNPVVFSGVPFLANSQANVFYPFSIVFLLGEPDYMFSWFVIIHFFLAAVFMYFFARAIRLESFPALVSALAFGFSGYASMLIYAGHLTIISSIVWIPAVFLFFEFFRQKKRMRFAVLLGMALALQFLGGHAQIFLYTIAGLVVYAAAMLLQGAIKRFLDAEGLETKKNVLRYFAFALVAAIVFLGLSAAQLVPTIELSNASGREGSTSFEIASSFSLPYQNILSFVFPNFFGNPVNHTYWGATFYQTFEAYAGAITLLLALTAIFFARNRSVVAFLALAVFSLLFALGSNFFLFKIFYDFVPGFSLFRAPTRMLAIAAFSLAVLAGLGAQSLLSNGNMKAFQKHQRKILFVSGIILAVALSAILFRPQIESIGEQLMMQKYSGFDEQKIVYFKEQIPKVFDWMQRDIIVLCLSIAGFAAAWAIKARKNFFMEKNFAVMAIIIFVLAADLFFYGWIFFTLHDPQETFATKPYIDFLKKDNGLFRIMDYNLLLGQELAERNGMQKINGFEFSVMTREYIELTDLLKKNGKGADIRELTVSNFEIDEVKKQGILDMLNMKYVVTKKAIKNSNYSIVFRDSDSNAMVFVNKTAMPRAFAVPSAIVLKDAEKRLGFIASKEFNPRETVVLEKEIEAPLGNGEAERNAKVSSYSPDRIAVDASFEKPGFLVLSENYYPGWKAIVDGKETELLRANHSLRAVFLESGQHEIEFVFSPKSYEFGYIVSAISIVAVLGAILLGKKIGL